MNSWTFKLVMTELPCRKSRNGLHLAPTGSYFTHGFVWTKSKIGNQIQSPKVQDIDGSSLGKFSPLCLIDLTANRASIITDFIKFCSLLTTQGTGYEIFVDSNGKIVVGIVTRKEYLATSVSGPSLIDKKWHLITIGIIPPKRPFAYTQITSYIDGHQKLGATIKFGAFTEPFSYCTIGTVYQKVRRTSATSAQQANKNQEVVPATPIEPAANRGMFPSLIERTFLPSIVSQVPSYFSLPIRNKSSSDPNVKCYPIGMQDGVFGPPCSMRKSV